MFIRKGEAIITQVYDRNKIASLKEEWHKIVKSDTFCTDGCPFVRNNEFEYDPDNFLYYRARAITADKPNLNGDLFPAAEIDKSYLTFIGKGVYYNHDSDNASKAFGLVLDAEWYPNGDDKYVEILGAIDRELAEQKVPGLIKQISSGVINGTSMSCSVQAARCSICQNLATNVGNLCPHMNPQSLHYVKGKRYGNDIAYEINYDITFTEDSIVPLPADESARVFELYTSASQNALNKLLQHYEMYWKRKTKLDNSNKLVVKAIKEEPVEPKEETKKEKAKPEKDDSVVVESVESIAEIVKDRVRRKFEQHINKYIDDEIRRQLGKEFTETEKVVRPLVEQEVKEEATDVRKELKEVVPTVTKTVEPVEKVNVKESSLRTAKESESGVIVAEQPETIIELEDGLRIKPSEQGFGEVYLENQGLGIYVNLLGPEAAAEMKEEDIKRYYNGKIEDAIEELNKALTTGTTELKELFEPETRETESPESLKQEKED
jgi:hypothetical protein